MTTSEFSIEFDILYNNISSGQAPGITEYEKSVFLTQAQESYVVALYSGKMGNSFEQTEEISEYLKTLLDEFTLEGFPQNSVLKFPKDKEVWYRVYESVILKDSRLLCKGNDEREADVYPVTNDTFYRTKNSPFRGSNTRRVLRLDVAGGFRLDSEYNVKEYLCRFIRRPSPIILTDLDEGLKINGVSSETACELPSAVHRTILTMAVELAKNVWKG